MCRIADKKRRREELTDDYVISLLKKTLPGPYTRSQLEQKRLEVKAKRFRGQIIEDKHIEDT